jgi:multimeric flavodoxin WrbA
MNVVAIMASPRLHGNTSYLVDQALNEAGKLGVNTEKIALSQHIIHPCDGHINCASLSKCAHQDDAVAILDKFRKADAVILATPVYYYNATAQMKAFIDRNYFFYMHEIPYNAKAAGIIVVAEESGLEDAVRTLNLFLSGMNVPEDKIFIVSGLAFEPNDAKQNPALVGAACKMGRQLAESIKK